MANGVANVHATVYAGFWIRGLAALIDLSVVLVALFIFAIVIVVVADVREPGSGSSILTRHGVVADVYNLLFYGLCILYFPMMEASRLEGTVGKYVLGLKVVDTEGQPIRFGRAVARYVASWLSWITLGIGYIMAAFTDKHQALHDKLAKTYVVRRAKGKPAYAVARPPAMQ